MGILTKENTKNKIILLELGISEYGYKFDSDIKTALASAEVELTAITSSLNESISTLKKLTPECDKTDYILAACSGAICGVMDIFLVGKPGESPVGDLTDKWFEKRTMDFAKMCGWDYSNNNSLSAATKHLEKKFKIPYDQRGAGDAASWVFDLSPKNHHFKSLGHNPTLLGLFFSILNQFTNTSHFVSGGELIVLQEADSKFELQGKNIPSKLFCGFVNWFGHLISDMSGSSSSKGRGMGIPSPLWSWTNDLIATKRKLNIPVSEFNKLFNELALEIYKQGYDIRFQAAQAIPVFLNEILVRMMYSIRRLIRFFTITDKADWTFSSLWKTCEPFSNATVKRMLTVAHGAFCLVDVGDAVARGFISGGVKFNVDEFFMRFNIVGVGRFTISLYGEARRGIKRHLIKEEVIILRRKKNIIADYVEGLKFLAEVYDDKDLLLFTQELKESNMYIKAFEKSTLLAEKRNVPKEQILRNKDDIDFYFKGDYAYMDNKKKSDFQRAQDNAQEVINSTNKKIEELGGHASELYKSLTNIQELFDKIRNVPSDKKLQYKEFKKIRLNWKQQAEKLEKDYQESTIKNAGMSAVITGLGVSVVTMGPTVAMGVATTFGVASTGTAISTLSGAAATNAALAWLGGGSLATGGGGMAAGSYLLTLVSPLGGVIAGGSLLGVVLLFLKSSRDKKCLENIFIDISHRDVNSCNLAIIEIKERISRIIDEGGKLNEAIENIQTFGLDYNLMTEEEQYALGSYVNLMLSSTQLLINPIKGLMPKFSMDDFDNFIDWKDRKAKKSICVEHKDFIVSLANLLYNIYLDDRSKELLWKSLRNNEKMLKSMDISKKKFDMDIMNATLEALKYKQNKEE